MITLYHVPGSRSMRSLWLLKELGLEFDRVEMPFDLTYLRAPDYLAVHPLGRVPALRDGDITLFESGAICQYLCERYDNGELGRAPDHAERNQWLQWVHFAETLAVHGAALLQQQVFIKPEERSEIIRKLESRRLTKAFEVLDAHLANSEHLLPGGFSAADIGVGYSVYLGNGFVTLDAHPNLSKYMQRLKQRPAFKSSEPGVEWQASQ